MNFDEILISLESCHAENILQGTKIIELRRRRINAAVPAKVWFYVKQPIGAITGFAIVDNVISSPPKALWHDFGQTSGVNELEFFEYFQNCECGHGLLLSSPTKLRRPIGLSILRQHQMNFSPPQFYRRIYPNDKIAALFRIAI